MADMMFLFFFEIIFFEMAADEHINKKWLWDACDE